ncbi:MAG: Polyribonucleotide nucleotidyltransferase [Candidatus Uhrbacteria bacterium GW2011_GWE2_45_35]|uniref:Polyribonucleotide nucleotidyltransferase n=1 Tax=Candidatus Uhrbacteria bacterium GW2011_GWE2_45_35 TaxID=1618993 RepID=A0A0G1MDL5_9BACT|nr:MAG: Polyribonucleotide nucleotidyltransferase [Candidatus Uhrbacteria bacterium GW2011_GWE2_45_35]
MSDIKRFETEWGGKKLSIETGRFAEQANGACTVQYGDTVVIATATISDSLREGLDFFPLQVEYEEKLYAAGRIKGSRFIKKEGRPTDEAVLVGRSIDRGLRPLFDDRMRNDIQVIVSCLAFDGENDPDIAGIIAASCAIHMSDIPWNGPIAGVRVGEINGEKVLNPSYEARTKSILDLAFAGTGDGIIMVEAGANEASEQAVIDGFQFGLKHLKKPLELIEEVRKAVGKPKRDFLAPKTEEETLKKERRETIEELARPFITKKTHELFFSEPKATKNERKTEKNRVKELLGEFLTEKEISKDDQKYAFSIVSDVIEEEIGRAILEEGKRVDGRSLNEIRNLFGEVALLPRVHGSGHFKRGETQVVSITTLGAPGDEQTLDGMETVGTKRFMHHYNFPPFSVGEVKPMRGPSRRDIGHGALAEKALDPMMPDKETFPYTIRVVSEVFGSNGSSSMASACGASLSLMDAGVPIKTPIAGIAMGLASNKKGDWKVFTDLQDLEDSKGGMDFKVAGSKDGITAIQMDTKTTGLSMEIVETAINQAREARMQILDVITSILPAPRAELSPYAPRIITLRINPEKIGDVIGPGGKMINEIIATTGVQAIDIEDDGLVCITSTNAEGAQKAFEWVKNLTREVVAGEMFKGKVTRLMDFGAFVEILPKQEGLVHVSKLAPWRVEKVSDIVKVGDEVFVKVSEIDDMGRINLSMKDAPGNVYPEQPANPPQGAGFGGGQGRPQGGQRPFGGRPRNGPRHDN